MKFADQIRYEVCSGLVSRSRCGGKVDTFLFGTLSVSQKYKFQFLKL